MPPEVRKPGEPSPHVLPGVDGAAGEQPGGGVDDLGAMRPEARQDVGVEGVVEHEPVVGLPDDFVHVGPGVEHETEDAAGVDVGVGGGEGLQVGGDIGGGAAVDGNDIGRRR